MPKTRVVLYRENKTSVPVLDWLKELIPKAQLKCLASLEQLTERGHELRRPQADYLRDGIYELRIGLQGINYRMLYFFHGRSAAVVAHGLVKERQVPPKDIETAISRKQLFEADPKAHTYSLELETL